MSTHHRFVTIHSILHFFLFVIYDINIGYDDYIHFKLIFLCSIDCKTSDTA